MEIAKNNWTENMKRIRREKKKQNANNKNISKINSDIKNKSKFIVEDNNENINIIKTDNKLDDITCLVIFLKE